MQAYIAAEAIAIRAITHTTLVAVRDGTLEAAAGIQPGSIVGVIEARDLDHISMLFVRTAHMGQGIASALLARAEAACRAGGRAAMTVNSSLNAQSFYARHGFAPSSPPQRVRGFAFVPMEKRLV
jgi:GNAT superfamily N-acetyltransferase